MAVREIFSEISEEWAEYKALIKVDSKRPVYRRIVTDLPSVLGSWLPKSLHEGFRLQGSTGAGNINAAPWIASFDCKVTTTATKGFYVVYLYSIDLRRLYLSIAFGTTQFEQYRNVVERHEKLEAAAAHLRGLANRPDGVEIGRIDLAAPPEEERHYDYQACSIFAIEYDLAHLPGDAVLRDDYLKMIRLYQELVNNPLLPSIERLLEAQVEPAEQQKPVIKDFVPREPKIKGKGNRKSSIRISKESKKVGDQGELLVVTIERDRLAAAGVGADHVIWHAQKGETPGWDKSSRDENGYVIHIEVKASVGKTVSELIITANEWAAAEKYRDQYFIYLVTDVMGAHPQIERLRDPWFLVQSGQLRQKIASIALSLTPENITNDLGGI